ncbi:hypothetical protein PESP_a1763 [Pseudoalteromonas espejiana DSM 9414]|uniref:Uncharacterized protein n=1 Tax=Pseudoalteromonas espejiana TaxID=28107 RepID=A0A510XTC1_9GAMM|nr:hypothetical protein [Pseudoalteromonas espejiana]ASM49836.1 hypothetical protein PESP_a1763 [Pseudoalteromonas espejiana DSM 9414]GEK54243.1 hypothetical protein PES01_10880 [Pseudoalteromonas espejiana]
MATATSETSTNDTQYSKFPWNANSMGSIFQSSTASVVNNMINKAKTTVASELDYEAELERMYQNQITDYEQNTLPIINDLLDEAESTSIVDRSRQLSAGLNAKTSEVASRQLGYSMGGQLASQQNALARSQNRTVAASRSATMTQAYEDQRVKQQAARTQLMSISEQLQSSGTASMSQAYQAKEQRDAAYKAAKGGFMSQVGAVAGGVIGGVFGGPMGAAAGASIGGAAGGMIGG